MNTNQMTPSAKASTHRSIPELSRLSAVIRNVAADSAGERNSKLHTAADALYDAGSELEALRRVARMAHTMGTIAFEDCAGYRLCVQEVITAARVALGEETK